LGFDRMGFSKVEFGDLGFGEIRFGKSGGQNTHPVIVIQIFAIYFESKIALFNIVYIA